MAAGRSRPSRRSSRRGDSPYQSPKSYIDRKVGEVPPSQRKDVRLAIDLANLLTGPTSGGHARELVDLLFRGSTPKEVATAMREAAQRYFR